jgi:predicted transcriptional regulator
MFKKIGSVRNIYVSERLNALNIFKDSCYYKIDFKINEDAPVTEAINRFNAFNVGCLAVTNKDKKVIGLFSERDYIRNTLYVKDINNLKIKDVDTTNSNIIVARINDSLETCMNKMMVKDIRHLPIVDDNNEDCIGMLSIKDLIKELNKKNEDVITRLSDFKLGKGAFFGSE